MFDRGAVGVHVVGSAHVSFSDCDHGSLSYAFDEGGVRFIMVWSAFDARLEPAQPLSAESLDFLRKELAKVPPGVGK